MEIVWRPIALEDLEEARRYIMQDDPQAAERLRGAILSTIGHLAALPTSGGPAASPAPVSASFPTRPTLSSQNGSKFSR